MAPALRDGCIRLHLNTSVKIGAPKNGAERALHLSALVHTTGRDKDTLWDPPEPEAARW